MRSYFWSIFSCMRNELSVFSPNTGKYGPEITPYLDTFHAVNFYVKRIILDNYWQLYRNQITDLLCNRFKNVKGITLSQ